MIRSAILEITVICLLLMMGAISCGDNSTGTEDVGEPPEVPEITAAQPDFNYFTQAKEKSELLDGHAFDNAQTVAFTAQVLFTFGQLGTSYFLMAKNEEPVFEDSEWIWSYSATYGGETLELKLTAVHVDIEILDGIEVDVIDWEFHISATGGETEFVDFKYMEGTTWEDIKGNWEVYEYSEEQTSEPLMFYGWSFDENDNLSAGFSFPNDDSYSELDYIQEGATYNLKLRGTDTEVELYWDTDADHGYWWDKDSDEKLCWNSNKDNIACSDIGL